MEHQLKQTRKQNWFQKQFSSRNGEDNRPKPGAHEAAIAAAAFAIQSVEEAKAAKLKRGSFKKENSRNGVLHSNRITTQFSLKKTKSAVENSKDKPMKHKCKEVERVHSYSKPSSQSATIPIAPGDEWYDKLKSVVCGGDNLPKTYG
ncbi:putative G-protein coupled receptor Mth-like 5 [Gossypium australe]|uniref:Putative G-protein coupled receptor Mth-like 5 n=1 Tax=Gossypium australe TaxID=47621 RepID=A0A5B6UJA4_9ROSI|nr:putative G-protein coupled receptor Mth-like 5 [Gossypium australe]